MDSGVGVTVSAFERGGEDGIVDVEVSGEDMW